MIQNNIIKTLEWQQITPDSRYTWLTEGLHPEFDTFLPMGSTKSKDVGTNVVFKTHSLGVSTNRDAWVYNFNQNALTENVRRMTETYNTEADRWKRRENSAVKLDDFVISDATKIKWSSGLKNKLKSGKTTHFSPEKIRRSLYRPFTQLNLYFDPRMMTERASVFPSIFPTLNAESENRVICVSSSRTNASFHTLMVDMIPDLHLTVDSQCFPFYTYDEDGTNRQENITDWALAHFQTHYGDDMITKWDIFHYNYAVLHHPDYREKYQANLKRDLPHIPFAQDFWGFANAGAQLADIHVNYESAPKYDKLEIKETSAVRQIDWQVEKMRFSKDKTQIYYNDYFTLAGIPAEAFAYQLGTRSALEWVVDQYRVKVDKRSGIMNDPNRADAPQYIVDLIGRVITVSLETVEIVKKLPAL